MIIFIHHINHINTMKKNQETLKRFMFNPQYQKEYQKILLDREIKGGLRAF